ncbi:MAG: DUF4406 domain-containing protein [Spirochaetota bacterium]|nr:DUF4406 domain-containing protein [Spirochaetota bacterium]
MIKVYISGSITNNPDYIAQFKNAASVLKDRGYDPINPVELSHNHDKTWKEFMKEDIKALLDCDCIYMLPRWENSIGANLELTIAKALFIRELEIQGE